MRRETLKFPGFPQEGPETYTREGVGMWLAHIDISPQSASPRKPARWVADDHPSVTHCPFTGLEFDWVRRRHHCRLCGGVFADEVCSRRAMLPPDLIIVNADAMWDINKRDPQRLCDVCFEAVQPIQEYMAGTSCNALQQGESLEVEGVRRYLNSPLAFKMEDELKKAAYSILNFTSDGVIKDKSVPLPLLAKAKGLAFMTVVKGGLIWAGKAGTGIVVARQRDGSWSAPSAIGTFGMSWGLQAGGEVTDFMILLNSNTAVDAFAGEKSFSLGGDVSVAVGPLGRSGGGTMTAGSGGTCACYTYSHSKGLFAGFSLEGSAIVTRDQVNKDFYGREVDPAELLNGSVQSPPAAQPLYDALNTALAGYAGGVGGGGGGGGSGGGGGVGMGGGQRHSAWHGAGASRAGSGDPGGGYTPGGGGGGGGGGFGNAGGIAGAAHSVLGAGGVAAAAGAAAMFGGASAGSGGGGGQYGAQPGYQQQRQQFPAQNFSIPQGPPAPAAPVAPPAAKLSLGSLGTSHTQDSLAQNGDSSDPLGGASTSGAYGPTADNPFGTSF
jgi:lipid-binding SYLF domain-containing protein